MLVYFGIQSKQYIHQSVPKLQI